MGSHWQWLGFAGIDEFVGQARGGAAGQARLMARYLEKSGLTKALAAHDWESVARGYNGPGYRKASYHFKLAAAYRRHAAAGGRKPTTPSATPALLRRGSGGEAVRDLQQALSALGYPVKADGLFGPATERAVRAFQRDHGLGVDGVAGPDSFAAMARALPLGAPRDGLWKRLLAWLRGLWDREC
jgi:murein L,D-transpeptidase YcbB/YkuD